MIGHNLVIEVTRECNMACEHCLRGDAQAKVFNPEFLREFITRTTTDYFSAVTFSGGEPSLHPEIIAECLQVFKDLDVVVDYFYIVTNGKRPPQKKKGEFLKVLIDLALYQEEQPGEYCSLVEISNDVFHDVEGQDSEWIETLKLFRFVSMRHRKDSYTDGWLYQGRMEYSHNQEVKPHDWDEDEEIYLNCQEKVVPGCNFSYENQDKWGVSLDEFIAILEEVTA